MLISEKLEEKGIEIVGHSNHHDDLKKFCGENDLGGTFQHNEIAEGLFSFLLDNLMNRYLFNLMLKKSPNIESWPINDEDLSVENLKKRTFGQSFIRVYKCTNCNHWLKRIYSNETILISPNTILECPQCGLKKLINFKEYENTFSIIKNDLVNFIEGLRNINVIISREYIFCPVCNVEIGAKDEFSGVSKCIVCKGNIILKTRYEFKDEFLKLCQSEAGLWFEWFVFEIAKHIYEEVDYGLNLNYVDEDGTNKEKEVDIVALKEDKLILIECKNYLGSTPPNQYRTIIQIAPFFDEVYGVNFFKPHKDVKKNIKSTSNIHVLNGDDIDNVFLDVELIISQLLTKETLFGTKIIASISNDKKIAVIKKITSDYSTNKSMGNALRKIIDSEYVDYKLLWSNFKDELKFILDSELLSISEAEKSKHDITTSLELVSSYYYHFTKERLTELFNPSYVLNSITAVNKLAENYDALIRKIYSRIFDLYSVDDFDLNIIYNDSLFDQIFDDLYHSYFENDNWRLRDSILDLIEYIFENITETKVYLFSQLIEKEFRRGGFYSGTVADHMFIIFYKNESKFGEQEQLILTESAEYLQKQGFNGYVISSAARFLEVLK